MGAATNFPLVNNHTWCGEHSERQLDVLFKRRDELIGLAKDAYQTMTNGCLPIVFPPLSEVKKEDGQS